jgi:hypothetical protein
VRCLDAWGWNILQYVASGVTGNTSDALPCTQGARTGLAALRVQRPRSTNAGPRCAQLHGLRLQELGLRKAPGTARSHTRSRPAPRPRRAMDVCVAGTCRYLRSLGRFAASLFVYTVQPAQLQPPFSFAATAHCAD